MKKIIALALAGVMTAFAFAGCSGQSNTNSSNTDQSSDSGATKAAAAGGDWSYIADKGEMVIGITYFEP
ncbi:MAG: amino acid ABC transporter substrate-binding protein, partial [Ruminococcus sp.]|nr:amino acid ABC transporter substrate-binding protein [Ruminococcus sp.]